MYRNVLIRWIMTYQVNSNIWHLNNWDQVFCCTVYIWAPVTFFWGLHWDEVVTILEICISCCYSQGRSSIPPKIALMNLLFKVWIHQLVVVINKITVPLRTLQASAFCPSHHLSEPLTKELFHKSLSPVQLQLLGKTLKAKYTIELVIIL